MAEKQVRRVCMYDCWGVLNYCPTTVDCVVFLVHSYIFRTNHHYYIDDNRFVLSSCMVIVLFRHVYAQLVYAFKKKTLQLVDCALFCQPVQGGVLDGLSDDEDDDEEPAGVARVEKVGEKGPKLPGHVDDI